MWHSIVQICPNIKKRIGFESVVAWCVFCHQQLNSTQLFELLGVIWHAEARICSILQCGCLPTSSDTVFLEVSSTLSRVRESSYHARVIQNWYTFCFTRLRGSSSLFKRPLRRNISRLHSKSCKSLKHVNLQSFPLVIHTVTMFQAERATPTEFRDSEGYDLIGACCALERGTADSWLDSEIGTCQHVMNGTPFHV